LYGEKYVGHFGILANILASSTVTSVIDFPKNVRLACSTPNALLQKEILFR